LQMDFRDGVEAAEAVDSYLGLSVAGRSDGHRQSGAIRS
jgi:hypothetical protein